MKRDYSAFNFAVLGDYMLDVGIEGTVTKVSEEFDEPVILNPRLTYSAGGAGNLAVQLAELGAEVHAFGVRGTHSLFAGDILTGLLENVDIVDHLCGAKGRTMTVKCRISSNKRRFVRVDTESAIGIPDGTVCDAMLKPLLDSIHDFNAVLVADYNKGVMTQYSIEKLMSNKGDVPVMVDPKYENFGNYQGATIFKPNLKEWLAANVAARDMEALQCEHVVVTKGHQGMNIMKKSTIKATGEGYPIISYHIPAIKVQVADITGAGDTVMAVLAAEYLRTGDIVRAAELANYAGSLVVQKAGIAHVTLEELQEWKR